MPNAVAELLRGAKPTRSAVATALVEHANMAADDPRRAELANVLRAVPAHVLVRAGLDSFDSLRAALETMEIIAGAQLSPEDVASIVSDFLTTWRNARSVYWYEELTGALGDKTLDALALEYMVEKEMRTGVRAALYEDPSEMTLRSASAAARMLGRGRSRRGLYILIITAHDMRRSLYSKARPWVMPAIVAALTQFDCQEVVPTLLLELANDKLASHQRGPALVTLARLAPDRVLPILEHLATTGEVPFNTVEALQIIGGDGAVAVLRRLCEFPDVHDRERAAEALRALGVEPPPVAALPSPEDRVAHAGRSTRYRALRELDERADRATLVSFLAAAALDNAIAERFNKATQTWKTQEMLPDHVRKLGLAKQLAWVRGEGAAELPEQVIWPNVERVLADGPSAVALTYPSPWPALSEQRTRDLLDEESQVGDALRIEIGVATPTPAKVVKAPVVPMPFPADRLPTQPTQPTQTPPPPPTPLELPNLGALFDPAVPAAAMPFFSAPPSPPSLKADVLDEILTVMGKERVPNKEQLARADLPPEIARMGDRDAARKIIAHVAERSLDLLVERLLAKLPEIHRPTIVAELCSAVFAHVIDRPGMPQRLLEMWEQAYALPWDSRSRATMSLFSVASHPAIFARMVDEIVAPDDGPLRDRTRGALELVSEIKDETPKAVSLIVARLRRDRGRPREIAPWRSDAMRALRRLASEDGVPTAILELAEITSLDSASDVFELLAAFPSGVGALQQAVDLRKCASYALRELCRSPFVGDATRHKYITHPFWKLRLIAAEKNPNSDQSAREVAEVWAAIDVAGIPVSADDLRYMRPDGLKKAKSATSPLPPPRDGMASSCFDYSAWALWAVDELMDPADAAARVFADELDIAMVERGHMRTAPRWMAWRAKVPNLPLDRRGRVAWAKAQADASLSPMLARVRDEGARVVAAELPGPCLVLPPELRLELEERECQIAEAGEALFSV